MQKSQPHIYRCWICGKAVDLTTCKTDEDGMAVHEYCYSLKLALASESKRRMVRKPPHRIAALWYLLSGFQKGRRSLPR